MFKGLQAIGVGQLQLIDVADLKDNEVISFQTLYQQVCQYREDLDKLQLVGTEGFSDAIRRLLTGLFNVVFHILHNFKTNIFKIFKDLKRTELRYYHEANTFSIKKILRVPYTELSVLEVPIPEGMIAAYPLTVDTLDQCLATMDMVNRANAAKSAMQAIRDRILSGSAPTDLLGIKDEMFDIRGIALVFGKVQTCLTKQRTHLKSFNQVYPTDGALVAVDNQLLAMEHYQQEVRQVYDHMMAIDASANAILDNLTKNPNTVVTKDDLQALSVICTALAKLFDMYGITVQDQHRVEHNHVEVLKQIRRKFNL